MKVYRSAAIFLVTRLTLGNDLKRSLSEVLKKEDYSAISIVSCVGSLSQAVLRFANRSEPTRIVGNFEIVSLTGTISRDDVHLHVSVSEGEGKTIGGHLVDGNLVRTTAEIVMVELSELEFSRKLDPESGFRELSIVRKA